MVIKSEDVSHNNKNGKEYARTLYICDADDVWVNVEVPKDMDKF